MKNVIIRIKDKFNLSNLSKYGFKYVGNWARGDMWEKAVNDKAVEKIIISGDWGNREINYGFPYRDNLPPIHSFISDLIIDGIVEIRNIR